MPLALVRKSEGVEVVKAYTYTPMRGSMGNTDATKRREALVAAHDSLPNVERERIDDMVSCLSTSNKYSNVGRLIALEILAAIGIGLGKEGYESPISISTI